MMWFIRRHLSFALLAMSGFAASDGAIAARIPEVHGTSLSNEAVNLPMALQGKVGVLVLGFSRDSREADSAWGKRLAADYRESSTVVYYEMPVLAGAPRMLRGLIVKSMKSSVPASEQARFIVILENEAGWKTITHYGRPDDPYVLVVDSQGNVVWQTQGALTDAAYAALKEHVEALRAQLGTGPTK
jgi:ATP synthase subunit 10